MKVVLSRASGGGFNAGTGTLSDIEVRHADIAPGEATASTFMNVALSWV